jgi:hypothetical protein
MVMLAFETMNKVRLEVRISRVDVGERSDLGIAMLAHPQGVEIGDQPPLASVSVRCSAMNLKTLDAAVLAALYRLDFQLALNELESEAPK